MDIYACSDSDSDSVVIDAKPLPGLRDDACRIVADCVCVLVALAFIVLLCFLFVAVLHLI